MHNKIFIFFKYVSSSLVIFYLYMIYYRFINEQIKNFVYNYHQIFTTWISRQKWKKEFQNSSSSFSNFRSIQLSDYTMCAQYPIITITTLFKLIVSTKTIFPNRNNRNSNVIIDEIAFSWQQRERESFIKSYKLTRWLTVTLCTAAKCREAITKCVCVRERERRGSS